MNPQINLNSQFVWDPVDGVLKYQVKVQNSVNIELPAGIVDVDAGFNSIAVSTFLTGQPLGTYKFFVRSVDTNGNFSDFAQINADFVAPPPPTNLRFI